MVIDGVRSLRPLRKHCAKCGARFESVVLVVADAAHAFEACRSSAVLGGFDSAAQRYDQKLNTGSIVVERFLR